jgi:hypothetical protein
MYYIRYAEFAFVPHRLTLSPTAVLPPLAFTVGSRGLGVTRPATPASSDISRQGWFSVLLELGPISGRLSNMQSPRPHRRSREPHEARDIVRKGKCRKESGGHERINAGGYADAQLRCAPEAKNDLS